MYVLNRISYVIICKFINYIGRIFKHFTFLNKVKNQHSPTPTEVLVSVDFLIFLSK